MESPWELNPRTKEKLLTPVYEACERSEIKLATCTDRRHTRFPKALSCDGSEEILKLMKNTAILPAELI